jgi:antitoxin (DNA-binding transcriptional repressor) of toxin-antitoxin stability system
VCGPNLVATKNGCQLLNMRTATIHELHMNTGKLIRAAAHEKIIITERGQHVALLKAVDGPDIVGKPFPMFDIRKMPKSKVHSMIYVSQDRDR